MARGSQTDAFSRHIQARSPAAFATWVALYVLLVILPLPLGLIDLEQGRGFWINFSVALGFVGLSMFGLQFLMTARTFAVAHPVGMDMVLRFHRQIAYVATLLVFAHPISLFLIDSRFLNLLDVFNSPVRAKFAVVACVALLILIALSVWRRRLHISYPVWQLTHSLLALLVVSFALVHVLMVGYYVREPWERGLWVVLTVAFICLAFWVRLIKPLLRRRRKWVVDRVRAEAGGATSITISLVDPGSYGPREFSFDPGQFAWLMARRSPFAITYHPFSIASSADRPQSLTFVIKELGGFTREIAEIKVGEYVYLDGPFGAFVLPEEGPLVAIGAGVGVTPLLSMLETMADRDGARPATLWLGNHDETTITCRADIEELQERMSLEVTHVLSSPGPGWSGETGLIDPQFVDRHLKLLGPEAKAASFCICGPDGMMDSVETALAAAGVPDDRIHSERFGMV